MAPFDYEHLFAACRELFGQDVQTSPDFLHYLRQSGIKSAFRQKAKETHPDKIAAPPDGAPVAQADSFCKARSAYEALSIFISQREQGNRLMAGRAASSPHRQEAPGRTHPGGEYFSGSMPQHPLLIGRYLYYRRTITFRELLKAVTWHRTSRRPIGLIAREWGWMTASDVFAVMTAKQPGAFGEKAIRLGILTPSRVNLMLKEQQISRQKIGQYFVQQKLLTPQELNFFLKELRLHNVRFGIF